MMDPFEPRPNHLCADYVGISGIEHLSFGKYVQEGRLFNLHDLNDDSRNELLKINV